MSCCSILSIVASEFGAEEGVSARGGVCETALNELRRRCEIPEADSCG